VTGVVSAASRDGLHPFVDLHTHSTASDGSRAPIDVARAAKAAGLSALALTDHDTLAGLDEACAEGKALGVRIIAGIELSAVEDEQETHVLGLHIAERPALERRLIEVRDMRVTRAERMVRRLNELGHAVTMEAVLKESAGGAVGRPHVARALIAGGFVLDAREAFEKLIGNGKPAFIGKDRLAMAEAIDLIHAAGGLAILAHPGPHLTRERVATLVGQGLDGIEVLHPSHSDSIAQNLDALVDEFDLVRSGGSDWHGAEDGHRTLGMMRVPAQWLEAQEARVARNAARRVA
jgi:predicted metal-dependent phosphoesterase TrpH